MEPGEFNQGELLKMSLGDLISLFYEQYLAMYGDEEVASVATAVTINQMLDEAEEMSPDEEFSD